MQITLIWVSVLILYLGTTVSICDKCVKLSKMSIGKVGNFRARLEDLELATIQNLHNPWTFHNLFLKENIVVIKWLQNQNLLASTLICPTCKKCCYLSKRKKAIDGYSWRCTSNRNHEYGIRKHSFFERSKFMLGDIMTFILCFLDQMSLQKCAIKSGFSYKNASLEWCMYCRELLIEYISRYVINDDNPLKLHGEIQIDESLFGRSNKYHRGQGQGLKVSELYI